MLKDKDKNTVLADTLAALFVGGVFLALSFIAQLDMPFFAVYPVGAFVIHLFARRLWRSRMERRARK